MKNLKKDSLLCPFHVFGNCRFGSKCRYTHGDKCETCEKFIVDPKNPTDHTIPCQQNQHKQKEEKLASVLHNTMATHTKELVESSKTKECVICIEKVVEKKDPRFGLLNCEHCVCLQCIRKWRQNEGLSTSKSCPICREVTHFIVPSNVWVDDAELKEAVIQEYKNKLKRINCKFYDFGDGSCPFGTSCFYKHANRDGTLEEVSVRFIKGSDDEVAKVVDQVRLSDFLDRLTTND